MFCSKSDGVVAFMAFYGIIYVFRGRLDMLSMSLLSKLQNLMEKSLSESSLTKDQIQSVSVTERGLGQHWNETVAAS